MQFRVSGIDSKEKGLTMPCISNRKDSAFANLCTSEVMTCFSSAVNFQNDVEERHYYTIASYPILAFCMTWISIYRSSGCDSGNHVDGQKLCNWEAEGWGGTARVTDRPYHHRWGQYQAGDTAWASMQVPEPRLCEANPASDVTALSPRGAGSMHWQRCCVYELHIFFCPVLETSRRLSWGFVMWKLMLPTGPFNA